MPRIESTKCDPIPIDELEVGDRVRFVAKEHEVTDVSFDFEFGAVNVTFVDVDDGIEYPLQYAPDVEVWKVVR